MQLPAPISLAKAPPLKCQGIKTKLVPFIASHIRWIGRGRWIEPFLGSGAVAFNLRPDRALLADTNPHVIRFYRKVQAGHIDAPLVADALAEMGETLRQRGGEYYYEIRDEFNRSGDSLHFLFLNRSCFNGMMRFNARGEYNVPFGKKPERFRKALVTRIANQVRWAASALHSGDYELSVSDFRATIAASSEGDFLYVDPPYLGRHTGYFARFDTTDGAELAEALNRGKAGYAVSMWRKNRYRTNELIDTQFGDEAVFTREHFYHVGPTEHLRNAVTEALIVRHGYAHH